MPSYDRNAMKAQLLNRTKTSYDRKDGDTNSKYFSPDADIKFFRPQPTKGTPHIIDILPFVAGSHFPPKTTDIKQGDWAYVLDLFIHSNVGPGKAMVVCPAKNYGNPCPICEEVEALMSQGVDWNDIPFTAKRRCSYNVLVMDDAKTEAQGVQVWEVSYGYSEKLIVSLARSPRGGGFIAFADPDKTIGKSIAFDVDNDTYKKITGHRFEQRDYDIPEEILEKAHTLDDLIVVHDEEQLRKILFGSAGKHAEPVEGTSEADPPRRSLRDQSAKTEDPPVSSLRSKPRLTPIAETAKDKCEFGAQFGIDYGKYGDCEKCEKAQPCAEAADRADSKKADPPTPPPAVATGRRTLLRRS
jgi:hypothetical protein